MERARLLNIILHFFDIIIIKINYLKIFLDYY